MIIIDRFRTIWPNWMFFLFCVIYILHNRYLLPWDLISLLRFYLFSELRNSGRLTKNISNMKLVVLSLNYSRQTYMNYIEQFAEISENTPWDILMGHIIRKRLSQACQPEADCRHLYWIIDFTTQLVLHWCFLSIVPCIDIPAVSHNVQYWRYPYWQPEPGIIVALRINLSCQQWRLSL